MNFRELKTSSGKQLIAGKNAEQNEEVVKLADKEEIVMHTKAPGSPFVVIKGKASKRDITEAAVFCAAYSRDFKQNHSDIIIHMFRGKDIIKEEGMKPGTFGVKKAKSINVKRASIINFLEAIKSLGKQAE